MSKLETNTIDNISGSSTLKIGDTNATTLDFDTGITEATNIPYGLNNTPAWSAKSNAVQAMTINTNTKINFGEEEFDTDSAFASSRFTVPTGKAGKYFVSIQVGMQGSANYYEWNAWLYKNGTFVNDAQARLRTEGSELNAAAAQRLHIAHIIDLAVGDYLEVYGVVGGSGSAQANSGQSGFRGYRLIGV